MLKDITTNASAIECFTPRATGWHHFSIHADPAAWEPDDPSTAASLTFSSASITINQLGTALHADLTSVTAGVVGVAVNLLADSVVTADCGSGSSHKVRIEAHPMKIA